MECAVAVQSNVRDLWRHYAAWMEAAADHQSNGRTFIVDNPLKHVSTTWHPHIPIDPERSVEEKGYGLVWMRVKLPCTLGAIGLNPTYLDRMSLTGNGLRSPKTCLYHQGSANTFLSSVHLLPDSHTVIVVLTNSMANNNAADWVGEYLLETVLDNPDKNDYVQLAKSSANESVLRWIRVREELGAKRVPGTTAKPLDAYWSSFYNVVGTYRIDVFLKDGGLMMCFQGHRLASFYLEHYHYDSFSWLLSHDEDVRHGMFPITRATFYLFDFGADESQNDDAVN
jgi:hypothetical protein